MTHHATYKGVPLEDIFISSIEWPDEAAMYIRTRAVRRKNDRDVEPTWATEAATSHGAEASWAPPLDGSDAIESDSLLVLGYSDAVAAVLKIWLRPRDLVSGAWFGVNAAFAKDSIAQRFLERRDRP